MPELAWLTSAFIVSAGLTWLVWHHARRRGLLDVPNERSSHTVPTPRGGGLAIVIVTASVLVLLAVLHLLSPAEAGALLAGGAIVAASGYLDDRKGLSPALRLVMQVVAAATAVGIIVVTETIHPLFPAVPRAIVLPLLVFGIVWSVNLFNFMDGIDGLAASQALFAMGAAAALVTFSGESAGWGMLLAATTGACGGFLVLNWPPARIFMGDVGSAFLGFWLATVAIGLHIEGLLSLWTSATLGTLFIVDATATLVRRIATGQNWHAAHRSHLYQRLAQRFGHRRVTVWAIALNLAVVLPMAILSHIATWLAPWTTCALLAVGIVICWRCGAGRVAS